nr:DNA-directed DNA polymerase [Tanacetum cinerariifolium]
MADNRTMEEMLQAPTEGYGDAIVEAFGEAWERFKEMLRQCPHHGFSKLHQIDNFYNGLNEHEKDSLNAAVGGNLLSNTTQDALTIIENKSKVHYSRNKPVAFKLSTTSSGSSSSTDARIDKLTDTILNLVETFNKKMTTPTTVKAVEETCVICGSHPYYDCIATDSNTSNACIATRNQGFQAQTNHASNFQDPNNQVQNGFSNEFANYMKTNKDNMRIMRNQMNNMKTELKNEFQSTLRSQNNKIDQNQNEIKNMLACLLNNPSSSRPLPSNTIANLRGDLKAITTRSGVSYDGPPIPPSLFSLPKVVERVPEVTKDTVQPSIENIQPPVVQTQVPIDEPVVSPKPKPAIPYPSRANKKKLREKDDILALKFVEIFRNLHFNLSFADALLHMPKFALMFKIVDYVVDPRVPLILGRPVLRTWPALIDVYGEELTLRVDDEAITFKVGQTSKYSYNDAESINRIDVIDVACEDVFILEEIKTFLRTPDELPNLDDDYYDTEGDILYLENLLNEDPSPNLPPVKNEDLKQVDATMTKPSIEEPLELELKKLPSHLEYAFLEGTDKLPVIISKELKDEEKSTILKVLKSHKRAIAWKISDIKDIDPRFCTYKILMEDDFKPMVQHQRRVNSKIHEVIKKEVIKLLNAGLIYHISDSPWSNRPSAPIIEDWVSDFEDESEGEPMPIQNAPSFVQTSEPIKTPRPSVKPVEHPIPTENLRKELPNTNKVNATSTPVTAVRPNSTNSTNSFSTAGPSNNAVSSNFKLDDEEDVGAEADFFNLETNITISTMSTTRVHKDHHVTQIIGDLSSAPQTKSITRMVKDQGSKLVFRNKKDKRGIVVRNKARLVAQGHTQEEGIYYEEVFSPVVRIEAISSKDPQNTDADATFEGKEPEFKVHVSPSSSTKIKKHDDKTKREAKGKSLVELSTRVRYLSDDFEEFSNNSTNKVNATSTPVTAVRPNSTNSTNSFSTVGPSNNVVSSNFKLDDEEDVGAEADFSNLETNITISTISTTRVHKDHPVTQIIGDLSSAPQTKSITRMVKDQGGLTQINNKDFHTYMFAYFLSQEEPKRVLVDLPMGKRAIGSKLVFRNKKDKRGIVVRNKARLVAQGHTQEEGIYYEEVFSPVVRIEAIRGNIDQTLFIKRKKGDILLVQKEDGIFICQDKYVAKILRKFSLTDGKSASTAIDTEKPLLKDPDSDDVDVHTYIQEGFRYLKGKPHLGLWYPKDLPFNLVAYSESDYTRASLDRKSMTGGCQFLGYRLISWQYKKQTIVATSTTTAEYVAAASYCAQVLWIQNQLLDYGLVRNVDSTSKFYMYLRFLQLMINAQIVDLSSHNNKYTSPAFTQKVFANMRRVGKGFSRVDTPLFDGMLVPQQLHNDVANAAEDEDAANEISAKPTPCLVRNVDSTSKFYMYLRFLQLMINAQIVDLSSYNNKYTSPAFTQKVFANMRRVGKGFSRVDTPLFDGMLVPQQLHNDVANAAEDEDAANEISAKPTPPLPTPATTPPPQAIEITKLKQRVRRLEKKRKLKASGLKRLRKVGTAQRVESSADTIMDDQEDASKQGGIAKLDADEDATLEKVDAKKDAKVKSKDKGKGILIEEHKPLKRQAQIEQDVAFAKELEAELNANINWNDVIEQVKRKERQGNRVMRYQSLKRKLVSEAHARKNMMEIEEEDVKRKSENLKQKAAKKQKIDEE